MIWKSSFLLHCFNLELSSLFYIFEDVNTFCVNDAIINYIIHNYSRGLFLCFFTLTTKKRISEEKHER